MPGRDAPLELRARRRYLTAAVGAADAALEALGALRDELSADERYDHEATVAPVVAVRGRLRDELAATEAALVRLATRRPTVVGGDP